MTPDADSARSAPWPPRGEVPGRRPRRRAPLLATAETGALDDLQRAQVDLLRAQAAFVATRGRDAPRLLLEAARRLSALDPVARARDVSRGAVGGDVRGSPRRSRAQACSRWRGPPERRRPRRTRPPRPTCCSTAWRPSSARATRPPCRSCGRRTGIRCRRHARRPSSCAGSGSPPCPRAPVGRHPLGDDLRAARAARPRDRRARRAPARAQPARLRRTSSRAS